MDGDDLKQVGMVRALVGANPIFKAEFIKACRYTAEVMTEFTADDVWERFDLIHFGAPPTTPNNTVVGALFGIMAKQGYAVDTGRTRKSIRRIQHRAELKIWRSLIFKGYIWP